jgi:uncharacterized membrane protein YhfC
MLSISFIVSIALQLLLPVVFCFLLIRKFRTEWRLAMMGGISYLLYWVALPSLYQLAEGTDFYASQIAGLPIIWVLLFGALISSVVEQAIRAGIYWLSRERMRTWGQGLTATAGQAALGMLLIGLQLLMVYVLWNTLTSSRGEGLNLSAEELANLPAQINEFWAQSWIFPLQVALQSFVILMLQFSLGMMVWQAVNHKAWIWLGAAVVWSLALNTVFKVLAQSDLDLFSLFIFLLTAAAHAGFLYWLNRKTSELAPEAVGK